MTRLPAAACLVLALTLPLPATAQGPRAATPAMPTPPTLTAEQIDRLVRAIPELARESGAIQGPGGGLAPAAAATPEATAENLERIDKVLKKHGFTFPDFVMQLNAMIAAYLVLSPADFDRQLPNEQTPAIQQILSDPTVPDDKKAELRRELAELQKNKDLIRRQLTSFASEENKKLVKPQLEKIRAALAAAEKESEKARARGAAAPGPRKEKLP